MGRQGRGQAGECPCLETTPAFARRARASVRLARPLSFRTPRRAQSAAGCCFLTNRASRKAAGAKIERGPIQMIPARSCALCLVRVLCGGFLRCTLGLSPLPSSQLLVAPKCEGCVFDAVEADASG